MSVLHAMKLQKTHLISWHTVIDVFDCYDMEDSISLLSLLGGGDLNDKEEIITITTNGVKLVESMACNHEEADMRIIYHLMKVDGLFGHPHKKGCIIITARDTDGLVLAAYYFSHLY